MNKMQRKWYPKSSCSHLFQRVASFLLDLLEGVFDRLGLSSHLFQRVASFLPEEVVPEVWKIDFGVLISFREWLHSYVK